MIYAACVSAFFSLGLSALNTTCNSIDEFECGNGDCVKYTLTCDGTAHCKDKSDEKQSYCREWNIFLCQNIFSYALVVDICNLSPFHFLCGSQSTVCARRVIGGVWMAAVWGTAPGATGETTVETILMNSSVTVSQVSWFKKLFLPAVKWNVKVLPKHGLLFCVCSHIVLSRSVPVQRWRLHLQLQQV